jgi:hypothetical protein
LPEARRPSICTTDFMQALTRACALPAFPLLLDMRLRCARRGGCALARLPCRALRKLLNLALGQTHLARPASVPQTAVSANGSRIGCSARRHAARGRCTTACRHARVGRRRALGLPAVPHLRRRLPAGASGSRQQRGAQPGRVLHAAWLSAERPSHAQAVTLKCCGHSLCAGCIARWLPKPCPTCRVDPLAGLPR